MTGNPVPATVLLVIMFGIPLLVMFFKEPLTHVLEKKAQIMPAGKGMFVVQGFLNCLKYCSATSPTRFPSSEWARSP